MTKLEVIEGIGPVYADQLRKAGVATVEALLSQGATPGGRQQMEQKTGIGHALILEWVNLADLMRIKGVGEEFSDLLEEAGVDATGSNCGTGIDTMIEIVAEMLPHLLG